MRLILVTAVALLALLAPGSAPAQSASPAKPQANPTTPQGIPPPQAGPATPDDFLIGAEDVLGVLFWRDTEMSGDVTVRPDGMITLPLVRDVKAAGLTPAQLADRIQETVREYVTDASVTVVVRQMNSRKVFITGEVTRPGPYPLGSSSMTVMQLIAVAGGLTEWAATGSISILRVEQGKTKTFPFDYKNVAKGQKTEQNIALKPGDTVVVPER